MWRWMEGGIPPCRVARLQGTEVRAQIGELVFANYDYALSKADLETLIGREL
ncbi:hypothetical protein ACFL3S_00705 [Gemmatimonadota bacterium]